MTHFLRRLGRRSFATDGRAAAQATLDSPGKQRLVVALGGNALLPRGKPLTFDNMVKSAKIAAPLLIKLAQKHEVILVHGNGPQVGILALMEQDYSARNGVNAYTLDCLGAETQGQIGYVLSSAVLNVPGNLGAATIVTEVLVDKNDVAFEDPTKFVGATYTKEEAEDKAASLGWTVKQDGDKWRRVVPSPMPQSILQIEQIKALLGASPGLVICCGGGGVPMVENGDGTFTGVEAVIDKDLCSALLAKQLGADGLIILTDGGGIWENFGKPEAREMSAATPEYLTETGAGQKFPGSMAPKVTACVKFVGEQPKGGGYWAAIGDLKDAEEIVLGTQGTVITKDMDMDVVWRSAADSEKRSNLSSKFSS